MISRVEFESLLHKLYAARTAGHLDQLCSMFAPDAVFEMSGASHTKPIAIRTTGSGGIRPWLALLLKTFRVTDQQLITVIIDGSKAAVRWRANIHSKITGAKVLTELVDLIEVENNHIISYIEFFSGSTASVN
jgi:ketosteroid isomerase-like protein